MTLYICEEQHYGANRNFVRYVPRMKFNGPLTPTGERLLHHYKKWCFIFIGIILLQIAGLYYYYNKFSGIDGYIQQALHEQCE